MWTATEVAATGRRSRAAENQEERDVQDAKRVARLVEAQEVGRAAACVAAAARLADGPDTAEKLKSKFPERAQEEEKWTRR